MQSGRRLAPAKINLTLEVLTKRLDGFHTLRSVVVPLAFADELSWEASPRFRFACSEPSLEYDDNLVLRAARALGLDQLPLKLTLKKEIPTGSGLGGGSSDAAALLLAAMEGAFGPQPERDWLALARELGSDVPLFLLEAPALIEATGERVTALGANPPWWVVLVCPTLPSPTEHAYRQLDALPPRPSAPSRQASPSLALIEALQGHDFATLNELLSNDFERVFFPQPQMAPLLAAYARAGQRPHLSGSGSGLFTLHENESQAQAFATALTADPAVRANAQTPRCVPFLPSTRWHTVPQARQAVQR